MATLERYQQQWNECFTAGVKGKRGLVCVLDEGDYLEVQTDSCIVRVVSSSQVDKLCRRYLLSRFRMIKHKATQPREPRSRSHDRLNLLACLGVAWQMPSSDSLTLFDAELSYVAGGSPSRQAAQSRRDVLSMLDDD